jgi:hypothetical protein
MICHGVSTRVEKKDPKPLARCELISDGGVDNALIRWRVIILAGAEARYGAVEAE